jgi:hypothetical protein
MGKEVTNLLLLDFLLELSIAVMIGEGLANERDANAQFSADLSSWAKWIQSTTSPLGS